MAILGTGSNSCYYDGNAIVENIFSLGYFFGDEGSGAYLGKNLISDYLHDLLPGDLRSLFEQEFTMSRESILDAVYNKPAPSRFLASFSSFIGKHRSHPYMDQLVRENFRQFFKFQVCCYSRFREVPVNFAGSVAHHYKDLLITTGEEFGIRAGKIIQAPVEGLVEYHLKETTEL